MKMAKPSRAAFCKSVKGFTLVETMVSVGIMSIILAGLATAVVNTVRNGEIEAKDSMNAMEDLMVQTAQQDYLTRAAPSYYFLHIPIRTFCSGSEKIPCLRQIDPATGGLTQVSPSAGIPTSIEFYKDVNGEFKDVKLTSMSAAGQFNDQVHMMSGESLDVSQLTARKGNSYVYASWPLQDENSEALPILVRKKGAAILSHIKQLGSAITGVAGLSLFNVSLTSETAKVMANDIEDSMAVIYNMNRPSQFVIQKITQTTNCPENATTKKFCKDTGETISSLATPPLEAAGFNNVMALKFDDLQMSSNYIENAVAGTRTHLAAKYVPTDKSVNIRGTWFGALGKSDFMFPRRTFSLRDDRSDMQEHLSQSPVDVKRIQKYFNINDSEVSLVVLPVDLGYIRLKQSAQSTDKLDLVVTSSSHAEVILVPSIKLKNDTETYVYVNRRLGTGIIEIFIK